MVDQVAIIFGFLKHNEIMHARICTTWRDAAKRTLVPRSDFQVKDMRSYNAARAMATTLPNMQQLSICDNFDEGNKYSDGEDPDEEQAAHTANYATHDLNIISNFTKLRILHVNNNFTALNGRYPALFNFPMLQTLKISSCPYLKWDLDMLSGFPLLRELCLSHLQQNLTGNLKSLRVLKSTLEELAISYCRNIQGNFMELADFPCLKTLYVCKTPITGDIQHIQEDDFSVAECISLPRTVRGGFHCRFLRISHVPRLMRTIIHPLMKRFPKSFNQKFSSVWLLSCNSADFYEERTGFPPPFQVRPVLAGSRWGWRWCSCVPSLRIFDLISCEVNWLDPEPSEDSDDYDKYVECLQKIEDEIDFYRGYYEPPTEEEYRRLCLSLREREV